MSANPTVPVRRREPYFDARLQTGRIDYNIPQEGIKPASNVNISNDLSGNVSDDDNTNVQSKELNCRRRKKKIRRENTLSFAEKELELLRMKIQNKVDDINPSDYSKPVRTSKRASTRRRKSSRTNSKEPFLKKNFDNKNDSSEESEAEIYQEKVQCGGDKFMLICEPRETKSRVINNKQIGNNNVIVNLNLNISSNACQILDTYGEVIQLGSEIWLEIKRKRPSAFANNAKTPSESSCQPGYGASSHAYDKTSPQSNGAEKKKPFLSRSPHEHTDASAYHSDRQCEENEDDDPIYDTVKKVDNDTISLKLQTSGKTDGTCLNDASYMDDVLLKKDVVNFMQDNGTEFDVAICEWDYEQDAVYSYVPLRGDDVVDPYATGPKHRPEPAESSWTDGDQSHRDSSPICRVPNKLDIPIPCTTAPPLPERSPLPYNAGRLQREDSSSVTIDSYSWYHGNCSGRSAEDYLKNKSSGSFLVRDSSNPSEEHMYTLVFNDENAIRRLKILQKDSKFFFSDSREKAFDKVPDLIKQLQKTHLEIKSETGEWKKIKLSQQTNERKVVR